MLRVVCASGVAAFFIVAAPAFAADLSPAPVRAPLPVPEPVFTWTGIYFGGHVGGSWANETSTNLTTSTFATAGSQITGSPDGVIGGGQVGFNYQFGQWLLGVEADASWSNATDSVNSVLGPITAQGTSDMNWFATLTGRFGYTTGNVLFYGKAGAAWMNVDYTAAVLLSGTSTVVPGGGPVTISDTRSGWTVGGGIEFAFWHNWSAKLEYDFLDFGSRNYTFPLGTPNTVSIDSQVHMVKGGVNYRFGWPAIGAAY